MKNYFSFLVVVATLVALVSMPKAVSAEANDTYVCGQSYGQPVVCGVKTPKDEVVIVKAGLKEDLRILGFALVAGSAILYRKAKATPVLVEKRV